MTKESSHINKYFQARFSKAVPFESGFSLAEILVAVSVFLVFVTTTAGITVSISRQIRHAGNKERAVALAEEALEATRSLRDIDVDFVNLPSGTFGISTTTNQWNLNGTSDTTDIFTRQVIISTINTTQKEVVSKVSWSDQASSSASIQLSTYLTDWKKLSLCVNQATFLTVSTSSATLINSGRTISGITLGNSATNCSILIDKITVSWTGSSGRRLQSISIGGTSVWTGSNNTGIIADISNYSIAQSQNGISSLFAFNNNISGRTFTFVFTMSDGTTKTISGLAL